MSVPQSTAPDQQPSQTDSRVFHCTHQPCSTEEGPTDVEFSKGSCGSRSQSIHLWKGEGGGGASRVLETCPFLFTRCDNGCPHTVKMCPVDLHEVDTVARIFTHRQSFLKLFSGTILP